MKKPKKQRNEEAVIRLVRKAIEKMERDMDAELKSMPDCQRGGKNE